MQKLLFLFFPFFLFSQENILENKEIDSLYREDQFYLGFTYNLIQGKPTAFVQNGFSTGLNIGFMRDMPINKKRTWAIATGLGYSYNNLKQNLKIEQIGSTYNYSISNTSFDKNNLVLHYLELPIEVRWRNSTPESHKFWRVYTGFKLNYLFANQSKFISSTENIKIRNNSSLNKLVFGPYLAVGYNSINLFAYYAAVPIAKNQKIAGENLDLNSFNIGFQFYIL
jgi:hypothetical protein